MTTELVLRIEKEPVAMKNQILNLVMVLACIVGMDAAAALKYEPGGYV